MGTDSEYYWVFDKSIDEPSEEYAFMGNILPDNGEQNNNITQQGYATDTQRDKAESPKKDIRVDMEAYSELTKADPHYRTHFKQSDIGEERWSADYLYLKKRDYFQMLGEIHRGEKNGPKWEHTELRTHELRRFLTKNIGGRLSLTELQLEQTVARATNVDAERLGEPLVLVIYCTCAYVVHEDEKSPRNCHPNTTEEPDQLFLEVAEQFDLATQDVQRVYGKLQYRFHDVTPPVGFDNRKPNWRPDNMNIGQKGEVLKQLPESPTGGWVYKPLSVTLG